MANKLQQRYQEIQTERQVVQKTVAELAARQANLEHESTRLNLSLQFHHQGVTRPTPSWFVAGGQLRSVQNGYAY